MVLLSCAQTSYSRWMRVLPRRLCQPLVTLLFLPLNDALRAWPYLSLSRPCLGGSWLVLMQGSSTTSFPIWESDWRRPNRSFFRTFTRGTPNIEISGGVISSRIRRLSSLIIAFLRLQLSRRSWRCGLTANTLQRCANCCQRLRRREFTAWWGLSGCKSFSGSAR